MADVSLAPAEVKNLGKLQLKIGQLTESVTVTADTAAVQTATSSRMGDGHVRAAHQHLR